MGQKNCTPLSYRGDGQNPDTQTTIRQLTEEGSDISVRRVNPDFVDSDYPHK